MDELEELDNNIALFEKGYDEPIDNKFLHNYIGGRQMGYNDAELNVIEDTAFKEIMDFIDESDIHYSQVDVYDFIPEHKRLTPYLIYQMGERNEYYTDDFVEYMTFVSRRGSFDIYDSVTDTYIEAPPSHSMAEYSLKGAAQQGSEEFNKRLERIVLGRISDEDLEKLKHKELFKKFYGRAKPSDLDIRYVNNLFPGGSYQAMLEESNRQFRELPLAEPEEITDDDIADLGLNEDDLADGDAMTEQFLDEGDSPNLSDDDPLDFARELGIVDEEPLDISDLSEADKEKLAGLSDETSTLYNSSDIENYANGNEIITPNQAKELEELTGIFHNQTNNIVEKLPIEETIKKRLRNKLSEMSVRWTTFSGAGELLDIYETAVLLFYGLVAAAPELEKVANNYMIDLYNTMAEPYGIKVSRDKYKPDWEYIGQQFDNAEKITPTDILINKVMDKEVDETNYIEEKYQVKPATDVKFELGNTINNISTMPKKDKETLDTYDRIAKTFGNYGKKTG